MVNLKPGYNFVGSTGTQTEVWHIRANNSDKNLCKMHSVVFCTRTTIDLKYKLCKRCERRYNILEGE